MAKRNDSERVNNNGISGNPNGEQHVDAVAVPVTSKLGVIENLNLDLHVTAINDGLNGSSVSFKKEAVIEDGLFDSPKKNRYILSVKPSAELINEAKELLSDVNNTGCAKVIDHEESPIYNLNKDRTESAWSNSWSFSQFHDSSSDDYHNLSDNHVNAVLSAALPDNKVNWRFETFLQPKNPYANRTIQSVFDTSDVELLSELFYEKPQLMEEVTKYLTNCDVAGKLYEAIVDGKNATIGRTVINSEIYSQKRLISKIASLYGHVPNIGPKAYRNELVSIIAVLFSSEISCLGFVTKGRLKITHTRLGHKAVDISATREYLQAKQFAEIVSDYAMKGFNIKYDDILRPNHKSSRLGDIFDTLYENLRHGLSHKLMAVDRLSETITGVQAAVLSLVLNIDSAIRANHPEVLENKDIQFLSRNYTFVKNILDNPKLMLSVLVVRYEPQVLERVASLLTKFVTSNTYFELGQIASYKERFTIDVYETLTERRRIGACVRKNIALVNQTKPLVAAVMANRDNHDAYKFIEAESYTSYSHLLASNYEGILASSQVINDDTDHIFNTIRMRGLLTDCSDSELELLTLSLHQGDAHIFIKGSLNRKELVSIGNDKLPFLASEPIEAKFYWAYDTDGKILDTLLTRGVVSVIYTTSVKEWLCYNAQPQKASDAFKFEALNFDVVSPGVGHFFPNEWMGLHTLTKFKLSVGQATSAEVFRTLQDYMLDTRRFGAYCFIDTVRYIITTRHFENMLFANLLYRTYRFNRGMVEKDLATSKSVEELQNNLTVRLQDRCFALLGGLIKQSQLCQAMAREARAIVLDYIQLNLRNADIKNLPDLLSSTLNEIKLDQFITSNLVTMTCDLAVFDLMRELAKKSVLMDEEDIDA